MLNEPVVVAGIFTVIGTITGAGITAGVSLFNQRRSRQAASERLYDQHALEQKFKAYRELYLSFDDVILRILQANNEGVKDLSKYREEIFEPYRDLGIAWSKARIYIDDEETEENLREIYNAINEGRTYLESMAAANDESTEHTQFTRDYKVPNEDLKEMREEMRNILREKIDPSKVE